MGKTVEQRVIEFYSINGEHGELSNFALYPITLRGKQWPTTEHFFQAQKFADARDQEEIRKATRSSVSTRS